MPRPADPYPINAEPQKRVAVIGSGIAGLTTARALQRRGLDVVVTAREWSARTTSAGAGFSRLFP